MKGGSRRRKNDDEESSQRAPLMRPKVEQTAARMRYFKASFTGEIDLIEGIARNENRMRSASGGRRHDFTRVFVLVFRVARRERRPVLDSYSDRNTAAGEAGSSSVDLCRSPWFVWQSQGDLFYVRLIETPRLRDSTGEARAHSFLESFILRTVIKPFRNINLFRAITLTT